MENIIRLLETTEQMNLEKIKLLNDINRMKQGSYLYTDEYKKGYASGIALATAFLKNQITFAQELKESLK